ncbi:tail fiber assembly protein [Pseudomonas sp. TB1-B1]|uniref:tail fiber assembly protein n=1 Tax=Pseudomonas sp. TB1-B1 TaxID=2985515 RepID=UPI0022709CBD|nr:tail fiber assembly protein [Pseudomonas sp. TB1-B1]MCX9150563.1 tail fiber assembly protein [Pseudomonas sp. TB1-B1]
MFYSAKTGGFYDPVFHGYRRMLIADPAWIRPTMDVVLQPGDSLSVGDQVFRNDTDEAITLRDVPDLNADPDTIEVDNPDCLIPPDAVEITVEVRAQLLAGNALGKSIAADENGYPVLVDAPPASAEELVSQERQWRDAQLALSDGVVSRHRDELEESQETTLTAAQYAELQSYRRALRNWPEAGEFPLIDHRPPAPLWLTGQTE